MEANELAYKIKLDRKGFFKNVYSIVGLIVPSLLFSVWAFSAPAETDFAKSIKHISSEQRQFYDSLTASQKLGVHTINDLKLLFDAHREKVVVMGDYFFHQYVTELWDVFQVPESERNSEKLAPLFHKFLSVHDYAKRDQENLEYLMKVFGVNFRAYPQEQQKEFFKGIGKINQMDKAFGDAIFSAHDVSKPLQNLFLFMERVADLVDRGMSFETSVEMGKKAFPASESPSQIVEGLTKDIGDTNRLIPLFKKYSGLLEKDYPVLTQGMGFIYRRGYRRLAGRSSCNSAEAVKIGLQRLIQ